MALVWLILAHADQGQEEEHVEREFPCLHARPPWARLK